MTSRAVATSSVPPLVRRKGPFTLVHIHVDITPMEAGQLVVGQPCDA